MSEWSEFKIARAISLQTLARKCVVLVDNCSWTGHECDVLGVTTDLRIIDVEVKISRSDLKVDAKKDKWWTRLTYAEAQERGVSMWDRGGPAQHLRRDLQAAARVAQSATPATCCCSRVPGIPRSSTSAGCSLLENMMTRSTGLPGGSMGCCSR